MIRISWAITAVNEHFELERLLDKLQQFPVDKADEIIVLLDSTCTSEVRQVAEKYNAHSVCEYHRIFGDLNKDFATFKNFLSKHCSREYIIYLDADEMVTDVFIDNIRHVLEANPIIELFWIPRINHVYGLTKEWVDKWGWKVDNEERVNYPDYQSRICKKSSIIQWEGKVHEKIVGAKTFSYLPQIFDILHTKTLEKQIKQNELYSTLQNKV